MVDLEAIAAAKLESEAPAEEDAESTPAEEDAESTPAEEAAAAEPVEEGSEAAEGPTEGDAGSDEAETPKAE